MTAGLASSEDASLRAPANIGGDGPLVTGAGLRLVRHGADLVLLDVREDAYSLLPGGGTALQGTWAGLWRVLDPELREALSLSPGQMLRPAGDVLLPQPKRGADAFVSATVTWRDRLAFMSALADMMRCYWRGDLAALVKAADHSHRPVRAPNEGALIQAAARFAKMLVWVPAQGVCLYRAFFLLRFLQALGLDARWVFGVRTWPFQAHCWLQSGDLVLDEAPERVMAFTPILTV